MRLSDFINESIISVIKGINEFNAQPYHHKALYPDKIEFIAYVDEKGNISQSSNASKINITIPLNRYIK